MSGRRAAVKDGGSIPWAEHLAAWRAHRRVSLSAPSPERIIADRGGYTLDELRKHLGREPRGYWYGPPPVVEPTPEPTYAKYDPRPEWLRWGPLR